MNSSKMLSCRVCCLFQPFHAYFGSISGFSGPNALLQGVLLISSLFRAYLGLIWGLFWGFYGSTAFLLLSALFQVFIWGLVGVFNSLTYTPWTKPLPNLAAGSAAKSCQGSCGGQSRQPLPQPIPISKLCLSHRRTLLADREKTPAGNAGSCFQAYAQVRLPELSIIILIRGSLTPRIKQAGLRGQDVGTLIHDKHLAPSSSARVLDNTQTL